MVISFVESILAIIKYSSIRLKGSKENAVILDIDQPVNVRSLRWLLIMFQMANVVVYIKLKPGRRALSIAKTLKWHTNTRITWTMMNTQKCPVLCTDNPEKYKDRIFAKKIILHFDYSSRLKLGPGHYAMPYIMHTQMYNQFNEHDRFDKYRNSRRKIKILFCGNYTKDYDNDIIKEVCGKISRYQIVEHLKENKAIKIIYEEKQIRELLNDKYTNCVVLIDKSLRIHQSGWMHLLSAADFFICPPGLVFPVSHNVIEAMAIGTIPITNYEDWFFPSLRSGLDAMLFSSIAQFDSTIHRVLEMSEDSVHQMRDRVIEYFSKHISHKEFVERLFSSIENTVHLHLLNEERNSVIHSMMN